MRSTPTSSDCVSRRHAAAPAILFTAVTSGAWLILPAPRWALVTLGASATLLLITLFIAAFQVTRRYAILVTVTTFICQGVAISFTLDAAPTLSLGDPPGRMLSSFSFQSASHAIRYRIPLPQPPGNRMRVKLVLARPYAGPANLLIDVSGRTNGTMRTPPNGNESEREFTFEMHHFRADTAVTLTISPDAPDQNLRLAVWKSGLGRTLEDEPEYVTEYGRLPGLPDTLTGNMIRAWPLIWASGA